MVDFILNPRAESAIPVSKRMVNSTRNDSHPSRHWNISPFLPDGEKLTRSKSAQKKLTPLYQLFSGFLDKIIIDIDGTGTKLSTIKFMLSTVFYLAFLPSLSDIDSLG